MRRHGRRAAALLAAAISTGTAIATLSAPAAAVTTHRGSSLLAAARSRTVNASHVTRRLVPTAAAPGANLVLNPGAQDGAFSARGWDAVTIPGWQIVTGLPTVVRYGTKHFPAVTGRQPAVRDGQLFVGGAGGTAWLRQVISLRSASGALVPTGTSYSLSAWLGGNTRSSAAVTVTFSSAVGRVLGRATIGPVGGRASAATISHRAGAGLIPAGSASATVVLTLATTLTNIDGPDAPYAGYDRGVADDVRFSVSAPVLRRVLTAPAADIPRFQHVFVFYFENEDFNAVIGNTRQAPFLNSLLPRASLLSDFFAEEHPSDGNYLALAGGSTFGIPLDDPLEENPQYTIRARNISDLIGGAHETWKAYLQSADGPCDDTVHGYYWDDDMPMTYFADVRDRPAYCSAHLVPLQALQADLASAATTPNFAWVSPNDCSDMEGCGIRAGDDFLATELGEIMRSPAWQTQRSMAIITFDEDGMDHQRPAQRIPTIIIGSGGVKQGYVSHVRYTHYSLLRTIEAALGLGTLTRNDRYAQPVNDVFLAGPGGDLTARPGGRAAAAGRAAVTSPASAPGRAAATSRQVVAGLTTVTSRTAVAGRADVASAGPKQQTAFVVNSASDSVTPVNLVTRRAGKPIGVGEDPQAIAITPDGGTAYVVNTGSGTVTPISTATGQAGTPIPVGSQPQAIAITPDGSTAYVTNAGSGTVTPINLATGQAQAPIPVGSQPQAIAITPDGSTALVLNWGGASVTPISIGSGRAGAPIPVGSYPFAISIAPDGGTAYVANYGSDTVTPISIATRLAGRPVPAGQAPNALAITPDSRTVLAVGGDSDTVIPITAAGGLDGPAEHAGSAIPVGYSPTAVAVSASGQTAFVVNTISGTVTPVAVGSGQAGRPISVGLYSYPTAIELAPSGSTAVVVDTYGDQVTLVNTSSRRAIASINVGSYPVAIAIAG
jgi:YVTN family beta-propeller protein